MSAAGHYRFASFATARQAGWPVSSPTIPCSFRGCLAIMAKDVVHGDAGTYGLLSSGPGFGFVFAAVLSTMLTDGSFASRRTSTQR